jgi:hypothetical protein
MDLSGGREVTRVPTATYCLLFVRCYARNDGLGLTIPYEWYSVDLRYEPDCAALQIQFPHAAKGVVVAVFQFVPAGIETAAETVAQQLVVLNASTEREIETAFATIVQPADRCTPCRLRSVFRQPTKPTGRTGCAPRSPHDLRIARVRRSWRPHQLRNRPYRCISSSRRIRRQNP